MKKATWVLDYDYRTDKCYKRPGCAECEEPIGEDDDGTYRCYNCGEEVTPDKHMLKWFKDRDETKTEMWNCVKLDRDSPVNGCGGKKCVEVHFVRNPVNMKWEVAGGKCSKCGRTWIV